jgi:serine/threonine-protein kinase
VAVPAVANLPQATAVKELNDAGLKATTDFAASDTVAKGIAIRTVPREAQEVTRGTRVRLLVSSGPEKVTVPDVTGLEQSSAEGRLSAEGLGVAVQQVESDQPNGQVVSQSPTGGTKVGPGARVTITVSKGRPQVDVPDVTGMSAASALAKLRAAGLSPVKKTRSTTNQDEDGQVLDERPGGGAQVDKGRTVVIVVGKFKKPSSGGTPTTPTPAPQPPGNSTP